MTAYFLFEQTDPEGKLLEFIFRLDDPNKIETARLIIADKNSLKTHVQGKIILEKAIYNPKWSFHLDPDSIDFFELQMEVCDANATYIEKNLENIGDSTLPNHFWCPWSSVLTKEIFC